MRVAIIFYGLMRNLKATFPSIRKNIFRSLYRAGIEFDVYVHTYYLKVLSNHRSKEDNVPLDNEEWKMLYPKEYLGENGPFTQFHAESLETVVFLAKGVDPARKIKRYLRRIPDTATGP